MLSRRAFLCSSLIPATGRAALRERSAEVHFAIGVRGIPRNASASVWLPVPHDDDHQTIGNLAIDCSSPHRIGTGQHGNKYLHCLLNRDADLKVSFRATRRERLVASLRAGANTPDPGPRCCLGSDRLVPIDDRIRIWAREVTGDRAVNDVEKARAIYNHVVATVKYDKSGKGWGRGDIYYACDARRGNCTDFHAIFIGYCRAVGVPARFAIGLPLPPGQKEGEISGYHCWAEFYARGLGWIPIDASEAAKDPARREYFFGAHDEHRIELSKGRDLVLAPPQRGEPLNYFVSAYAELEGRPFDGLQSRVTFRDIP